LVPYNSSRYPSRSQEFVPAAFEPSPVTIPDSNEAATTAAAPPETMGQHIPPPWEIACQGESEREVSTSYCTHEKSRSGYLRIVDTFRFEEQRLPHLCRPTVAYGGIEAFRWRTMPPKEHPATKYPT